jgi:hypothetical protein
MIPHYTIRKTGKNNGYTAAGIHCGKSREQEEIP